MILRMNKIIAAIIILFNLLASPLLFGQEGADSLLFLLKNAKSSDKAVIYNDLSALYLSDSVLLSFAYAERALDYAQKNNDLVQESRAYYNLGDAYLEDNNHEQALAYYNKCIHIRNNTKDYASISEAHNGIGSVYYRLGEYDNAIKYF